MAWIKYPHLIPIESVPYEEYVKEHVTDAKKAECLTYLFEQYESFYKLF